MNFAIILLTLVCEVAQTNGVTAPEVNIEPVQRISLETERDYRYQVEVSPDLEAWQPVGPQIHGDGRVHAVYVEVDERAFFRISFEPEAGNGAGLAIGDGAVVKAHPEIAPFNADQTTAVGNRALAEGWRTTAYGHGAIATGVSSTAIGRQAYAKGPHMVALGRGAYAMFTDDGPYDLNERNVMVAGVDHLYLHAMAHRFVDPTGDTYLWDAADGGGAGQRWDVRTIYPRNTVIHGSDAFDARFEQHPERFDFSLFDPANPSTWVHRPDINVTGGSLTLMGGRGTGTASGGALNFAVAPPGANSGHTKNRAFTGLQINPAGFDGAWTTPVFLRVNGLSGLRQVEVGEPDSSGAGYRALRIRN